MGIIRPERESFDHYRFLPVLRAAEPKATCAYCGHEEPFGSLRLATGGLCCEDCWEFLATGIDPRPWCPACGRSVSPGQVCPDHPAFKSGWEMAGDWACCPECGRSLPQGCVCPGIDPGASCASCGASLPREELFVSLGKDRALCAPCWERDGWDRVEGNLQRIRDEVGALERRMGLFAPVAECPCGCGLKGNVCPAQLERVSGANEEMLF